MQFHPLADCFPLIEGDDFQALVGSIIANGQRDPIVLFDGMILDGRNRYRACLQAGVEPRTTEFNGTFNDARWLVIDTNIMRRHLDTSQRAMAATRLAKLADGQRQVGKFADVPTQAEAAKLLKVSERSVRDARHVIEHGEPELVQAVDRGEVAVSKAAKIAELPQEEQTEALKPKTAEQEKADRYFRAQEKRLKAERKAQPSPPPVTTITPPIRSPQPETVEAIPAEQPAAGPAKPEDEYGSIFRDAVQAVLDGKRFAKFLEKRRIVLQERTTWNGWSVVVHVERKKTKAEIAAPPVDRERLKLLGERAEKLGYRLVKKRSDYRLVDEDGSPRSVHADLDSVESDLDASEGKIARQYFTPCGMRIDGMNNSEAWLAAHPGKTLEDFERELPPMTSTCSTEAEAA